MDSHSHSTLFFLGRPLGPIYGAAMKLRAQLYRRNIFKTCHLDIPVISVGNLTMGGTGKTPMVIYLARFLADRGFKPGIISRGYHGKSKNPVNIVSDGDKILMNAEVAGDEPVMIARRLDGTIVATGKKRSLVSHEVIKRFECDAIILDDGFQHLGMARTIDLVLFDVDHFAGNSRVFPGGELREPVSALKRCDAFIITGVSDNNRRRAAKCQDLLHDRFADIPVFLTTPSYSGYCRYNISPSSIEKTMVTPDDLPAKLFGFSGIAHAERFYDMVEQYGITLTGRKIFRDHHAYTVDDIKNILHLASQVGAVGLLTTEKDIVKLSSEHHCTLPFYIPLLEYSKNDSLESFIINNLN